jgi:hypothetical protein
MMKLILAALLLAAMTHAQGLRVVYTEASEPRTNNCVPRYSTAKAVFVCEEQASAITWKGAWSSSATYIINDAVSYGGASYLATATSINQIPSTPASTYWGLLASSGGTLAGDVEGAAGSTLVRFVGGQGASSVATATIRALGATHINTPNTIVSRDLSGIFAGTLNGNAATATNFDHTPTLCPSGQAARGITAGGDAIGCAVASGGSGTPGGTDGQVQVNLAGAFGGVGVTGTTLFVRQTSPALLGAPTAPTPAVGTTGNQIITADFYNNSTLTGSGPSDGWKIPRLLSNGTDPGFYLNTDMVPFFFDSSPLVLTPICSKIRNAPTGGVFRKAYITAQDNSGADVVSTISVQFSISPDEGSTSWTNIGIVSLSGQSSKKDTTLSGWTTSIPANSRVRGCVIGTPAGANALSVGFEFHAN